MTQEFETDRSAILSFQKCNRDRWWSRHFGGKGLQGKSKSLALSFGGSLHEGLAPLVLGKDIEHAVLTAKLQLSLAFEEKKVETEEPKQLEMDAKEQGWLVEALLRAWELYEGKTFRETFEVLEVEEEGRVELGDGIVLLFRPDAVLRERATGDVYVLSWKSTSAFSQMTTQQSSVDMQSMSEVYGVQEKLGLKVEGVLYKYLVKGRRKFDDYNNRWMNDSRLIYCWKKLEADEFGLHDFAHSFNYTDDEGKNRRLGKGWQLVPVADHYPGGIKAWIEALAGNQITPRNVNVFDSIFPQMLPVVRREDEIESWKRQVVSQEGRVRQRVRAMAVDPSEEVLDREFPQSTARCFDYMSKCSFFEACHRPAVKADPLGSGLYEVRISNHPERGEIE